MKLVIVFLQRRPGLLRVWLQPQFTSLTTLTFIYTKTGVNPATRATSSPIPCSFPCEQTDSKKGLNYESKNFNSVCGDVDCWIFCSVRVGFGAGNRAN